MPNETTNQATRREWQELGFFYDRDDNAREWRLIGSRRGLQGFCDALLAYAADPNNDCKSEHEHFGPYMYLEVMTWPSAGFDEHSIHGPLLELKRLAEIIGSKIGKAQAGDVFQIREEFAADSPYSMILEVKDDDFDPAEADPMLEESGPAE